MSPLRNARVALYRAYASASPWYRAGDLGGWRARFAAMEAWPPDAIAAWQTERLRALLAVAETTALYPARLRRAGLSSKTLSSLDELAALTALDRRELAAAPGRAHAPSAPRFRPAVTSGSTGVPLGVRTPAPMDAAGRAAYWRMFGWFGVPFGAPTLGFGRGQRPRRVRDVLGWALAAEVLGQRVTDPYDRRFEQHHRLLAATRPSVVQASPNVLVELARVARARGVDLARLGVKLVVVGGEWFSTEQRDVLRGAFGCAVASLYGSGEGNFMATECPAGRLHVVETVLVEVVDDAGRRVDPGAEGEIAITPLLGHAMPLLRYRLGDRGRLLGGPCPCGRPLPSLALELTRTSDMVVLAGGRRVSSKFFEPILNDAFGRRFGAHPSAFRVTQRALDRVEIELAFHLATGLPAGAEPFVERSVRDVLGDAVQVGVTHVPRILPDRSGKRRSFVPLGDSGATQG